MSFNKTLYRNFDLNFFLRNTSYYSAKGPDNHPHQPGNGKYFQTKKFVFNPMNNISAKKDVLILSNKRWKGATKHIPDLCLN